MPSVTMFKQLCSTHTCL